MLAKAIPASPLPACVKNSLRVLTFQRCLSWFNTTWTSVNVQELVGVEQHLAQAHKRGRANVLGVGNAVRDQGGLFFEKVEDAPAFLRSRLSRKNKPVCTL